jgi:hypothetical protein
VPDQSASSAMPMAILVKCLPWHSTGTLGELVELHLQSIGPGREALKLKPEPTAYKDKRFSGL